VFKRVLQQRGESAALQAAAIMQQGMVANLDAATALGSAKTSLEMNLPMADSIILAVARSYGATLWTQDSDFRGIQGVRYIEK